MKSTITISGFLALTFAGAVALSGCSGASSGADGGDAAVTSDTNTVTAFALTPNDSCFDILTVSGVDDGCDLGVAALAGTAALPFNYDMTAITIKVGTDGSLGGGPIANNMATLVRDGDTTDTAMATCMWHEHVDSMVTVTAQNELTIHAVRTQSMFKPACSGIPTGGMCTSTWTWTMKKSTTKTVANGCK